MKTESTINCPACQHAFPVEAAFASQLRGKLEAEIRSGFDARLVEERRTLTASLTRAAKAEAERSTAARLGELEAVAAERHIALKRALAKLETAGEEAAARVRSEMGVKFVSMDDEIERQQKTIITLRKQELKMTEEKAKLEERQHELEMQNARTIETERARLRAEHTRVIDAERVRVREELASAHAEAKDLREAEFATQTDALRRQVDELRRKLEAGGEQQRGEVCEVRLEEVLRAQFPSDTIEAVAKGVSGADVRQRVCSPGAKFCGTILYENKHTAAWSPRWTTKLRDDQRAERADVAVLVTAALPKQVTTFSLVDGVWVTNLACLPSLALALRMGLLQLASHRQAAVGRGEKMELVYAYLTGDSFKRHVESLVATYEDMGKDLFSEKTALTKMWKRREQQLERVTASITSFYGDLQTIAGAGTLPEFASLELAGLVIEENAAPSQVRLQQPALI